MYHYPTVTYSQLVAASVILPPRIPSSEGTRGATPPKKYIKYIITFL